MKNHEARETEQSSRRAAIVANVNKCQWMFLWDITKFSIFIQKWMNRNIVRMARTDEEQEVENRDKERERER